MKIMKLKSKKLYIFYVISIVSLFVLSTSISKTAQISMITSGDSPQTSDYYEWNSEMNLTLTTGEDWTKSVAKYFGANLEIDSVKTAKISNISINDGSKEYLIEAKAVSSKHYTRLYDSSNGLEAIYESSYWYDHDLNISTGVKDIEISEYRSTTTDELQRFSMEVDGLLTKYYYISALPLEISDDFSCATDNITLLLGHDATLNYFNWTDQSGSSGLGGSFSVTSEGVWHNGLKVIDWATMTPESYTYSYGNNIVNINGTDNTIVFSLNESSSLRYELIFSKLAGGNIILTFVSHHVDYPLMLQWIGDTIDMRYGVADDYFTLTQKIGIIDEKIYEFSYDMYNLDVTHYKQRGIIKWEWISVEIYKYNTIFEWMIIFNWYIYSWNAQWVSTVNPEFLSYTILMELFTASEQERFFYEVPTVIMPNKLIITLQECIYSENTFTFFFNVTTPKGEAILYGTMIGTWNNSAITSIVFISNGVFRVQTDAILIAPGDPGIPLTVTVSKLGFSDGYLNTIVGVDPEAVDKSSDGDGGPGLDNILLIIIASIAVVAVLLIGVLYKINSMRKDDNEITLD